MESLPSISRPSVKKSNESSLICADAPGGVNQLQAGVGSWIRQVRLLLAVLAVGATTGCGTFKIPVFQRPSGSGTYVPVGEGIQMSGGESLELYQKLKQAKRENSVVLEVVGDDVPIRVLPLPPGQTSVFVSQLLQQTGVQAKLGSVDATLFRYTSDSVSGIPMAVRMDEEGEVVRPESDYALRPGDRLQVSEKEFDVLGSLSDLLGA